MARPEAPLNCPPRRHQLASVLREARARTGATYADMAARGGNISPATLKRTASGDGPVPKWANVQTYYTLCAALSDGETLTGLATEAGNLRGYWVQARKEERGTLRLRAPRPEYVRDEADLSRALYVLYENAGAPSLRELQRKAGGPVHMPLTTAARIVARQALPSDTPQFKAFIEGCSVPERKIKTWMDTWYRVMSKKRVRLSPGRSKNEYLGNGWVAVAGPSLEEGRDATVRILAEYGSQRYSEL
ncbi:helix-turn-helix domain-containing protein [Streptomyces sp. NPDC060011]|uniref:helix-turn-helix domain-containing protein n=1 Tax=Streptomyces sp. NPDC060011 TaxID=3347037 RepID=UPI0036C069DE